MKFMHPKIIVTAVVVDTPCEDYFFVRNGDPRNIFCHRNQGGYPTVDSRGVVTLTELGQIEMPPIDAEIVLVRESTNPADSGYTKALGWTLKADWNKVAWATNAKTTYKAVVYNHLSNGKPQSNTDKEVVAAHSTLLDIIRDYPRRSSYPDPLGEHYNIKLKDTTLSYNTAWYRRETDGSWTECADPRPVVG